MRRPISSVVMSAAMWGGCTGNIAIHETMAESATGMEPEDASTRDGQAGRPGNPITATDGGTPPGQVGPDAGPVQMPSNGVTVTISPTSVSLAPGGSASFSCTVTGTSEGGCDFSVDTGAGSIDTSGAYTAPSTGGSYRVLATSRAEPGASASSIVTVRTVTPCPSGSGTVGVWENISPDAFRNPSNMETMAVVVDPQTQAVYAGAGNITNNCGSTCMGTGVLRSLDCGATWENVSTGRNSDKLRSGDPWAMLIDPVHPSTLYTNNGYGGPPALFKSTNGGVDWDQLNTDPTRVIAGADTFIQAIALEATNPQHLAVTYHDTCKGSMPPFCISRSTDGGANWQVLPGPRELSNWQEGASITVLGTDTYFISAPGGGFFSSNAGTSWTRAITTGITGSYAKGLHIGPDGTLYTGVDSGEIHMSKATAEHLAGEVWTPIAGSPRANMIIDDGESLFSGLAYDTGGRPFWSAPLNNLGNWTHMESTTIGRGANQFAYDSAHHIVYAANWGAGLWRLRTR